MNFALVSASNFPNRSSWHSNEFRSNQFIDLMWKDYHIMTREHFYHVGAKEENRNPMLEALVTNFAVARQEKKITQAVQLTLFQKRQVC
jgi:DNA adenine methylase